MDISGKKSEVKGKQEILKICQNCSYCPCKLYKLKGKPSKF